MSLEFIGKILRLIFLSTGYPLAHNIRATLVHRLILISLSYFGFQNEPLVRVNDIILDVERMVCKEVIRKNLGSTTFLPRLTNRRKKER